MHRRRRRRGIHSLTPHRRLLRGEVLEDRRLLSITVDTLLDEFDGIDVGTGTSLREAIFAVEAGGTIDFDPQLTLLNKGVIGLTLGQLKIAKSLSICGPGANLLTIDAGPSDPSSATGDGNRIFLIDDGNHETVQTVFIGGVTLIGGDVTGPGGGIYSAEELALKEVVVTGNSATSATYGADYGYGGGIYATRQLTLESCLVANNRAIGFMTYDATFPNFRVANGGGVFASGDITIINSTISGNAVAGPFAGGGGLMLMGNVVHATVNNSTVTANHSDLAGGGICVNVESLVVQLDHTILANNTSDAGADGFGSFAVRFSIIGSDVNMSVADSGGNQIGSSEAPISPALTPLVYRGGASAVHLLLPDSPALDAGDPLAVAGVGGVPLYEQRGTPFSRVAGSRIDIGATEGSFDQLIVDTLTDESDGDISAGDMSLREAIELANLAPGHDTISFASSLTSNGSRSLSLTDEIRISQSLTLNGPGAELLAIHAFDPDPNGTGDGRRIFNIDNARDESTVQVRLSGMTLTRGDAADGGGAVRSLEELMIDDCVITGNFSPTNGGAILQQFGSLTVSNCVIDNNSAGTGSIPGNGAAIWNSQAALLIINSRFETNHAYGSGGAIHHQGGDISVISSTLSGNLSELAAGSLYLSVGMNELALIRNSTISGNQSSLGVGGVFVTSQAGASVRIEYSTVTKNVASNGTGGIQQSGASAVILDNSIVAKNDGLATERDDVLHEFIARYSLVGQRAGSSLLEAPIGSPDVEGNLIGGPIFGTIDPLLGPLADNGGPTKTHALLPDSPAIDAGDPLAAAGVNGVPEFDQRGAPWQRVANGDDIPDTRIDMGAVEQQANPLAGDYNFNGVVDGADYTVWKDSLGSTVDLRADGDGDGNVDADDYAVWKLHFGELLAPAGGGGAPAASQRLAEEQDSASIDSSINSQGGASWNYAGRVALNPQWRASNVALRTVRSRPVARAVAAEAGVHFLLTAVRRQAKCADEGNALTRPLPEGEEDCAAVDEVFARMAWRSNL